MIDFDKWRRLSIPTKPDGDYIPFAHIMKDEYAYIIQQHKKFTSTDPVEHSMSIINGDLDSIKYTVKELFAEDRRLQAEYKRSNNDKDFYNYDQYSGKKTQADINQMIKNRKDYNDKV